METTRQKNENGKKEKIIIPFFPYASLTPIGTRSPKEYPYWADVIRSLKGNGIYLMQVNKTKFDPVIEGVEGYISDLPLEDVVGILSEHLTWIAVDNFAQHLSRFTNPLKRGIVVWGPSDPDLFGYPENFNIYKSREHFRPNQYDTWDRCLFPNEHWISVDELSNYITSMINQLKEDKYVH